MLRLSLGSEEPRPTIQISSLNTHSCPFDWSKDRSSITPPFQSLLGAEVHIDEETWTEFSVSRQASEDLVFCLASPRAEQSGYSTQAFYVFKI
ncbi:hypothetical protein CCM_09003 [Cordyceps militaris CM01]|uniref:Uncharacterized protein n=1 Tax=Cordyceps militaris (strain CM01) TaxID=983644 RepID=G3JSW0_CORMM|nr:uncharacterized protein CCM_09003 [Cordyceps militaris CM01]EGX88956.1 hypothetical protein CCM_09003 [Cordyceps militaris CM01]